jgi:hypothetical protein
MNRWASRNPERAVDGQLYPHPHSVMTDADRADIERKEKREPGEAVCLCSHTLQEHTLYGACRHTACGCKEFRT